MWRAARLIMAEAPTGDAGASLADVLGSADGGEATVAQIGAAAAEATAKAMKLEKAHA